MIKCNNIYTCLKCRYNGAVIIILDRNIMTMKSSTVNHRKADYDHTLVLVDSFCNGKTKLHELLDKCSEELLTKAITYISLGVKDNLLVKRMLDSLLKRLTSDSFGN